MTAAPLSGLPTGPVASMDAAVARMQAIAAILPQTDGLACFNRMYLLVTEAVRAQVGAGFFADPDFMAALDVHFANRFLAAIDAYRTQPGHAPRSWSVLLDARSDPALAPMQFALAGLNAHINLDLAVALVQTCSSLRSTPDEGSHQADFEKVNGTLATLDQQVRESFEQGVILDLDRQCAGLENLVGMFGITAARETAWVNARMLWRVKDESFLYDPYLDGLDRGVAFAGRALLLPLARG